MRGSPCRHWKHSHRQAGGDDGLEGNTEVMEVMEVVEGGREGGDVKLKLLTWDTGVERGERYAGDNLTLSYFDLEFY